MELTGLKLLTLIDLFEIIDGGLDGCLVLIGSIGVLVMNGFDKIGRPVELIVGPVELELDDWKGKEDNGVGITCCWTLTLLW